RVGQVGGDEPHPVVPGEVPFGDGEQGRVDGDARGAGLGEALEQPVGDAAGPAGEVEDVGLGAAERLHHVERDAEAFLAVGHVPLLLAVPAVLPCLPGGLVRHGALLAYPRQLQPYCKKRRQRSTAGRRGEGDWTPTGGARADAEYGRPTDRTR